MAPDAVEADERRVPHQVEQGVGHLHGGAGIGERLNVDAGEGRSLVGVQGDRETCLVQRRRRLRRLTGGADHTNLAGDAGAEVGNQVGRQLGRGRADHVGRPRPQPLGRRALSDDDQHVHVLSRAQRTDPLR